MSHALKPREKLVTLGAQALSDEELLAIFLRIGVRGKTVTELAADLLRHFGGVSQVLAATLGQFEAIHGLGLAKYAQLQAAHELVKRAINEQFASDTSFANPGAVDQFLKANFECCQYERFAALFLNSKNHLLKFEYLFNGSINSAQVYPRTVAQHCLKLNAAAVIFAHNHPSGDLKPSTADIELTQRLRQTLALIDVKVLDHFVVNARQTFSMAAHQMI
ncbi:RadC family protein [Marinicella meishanensis]|uniref:RadC family protein n=1 Tax=Marinicella meishanensis TaxID=2873263 RepID=UPI001CC1B592|nr:DNA repair protein RadC [Marinicella sp. NBU2979]